MLNKFLNKIYGNVTLVCYLTSNLGPYTTNWSWGNLNSIGSKEKLEHKWGLRKSKRSVGSAEDSFGEEGPKNKSAAKKKRTKKIRNTDKKSEEELACAKEHTSSESMGPIEEQQPFVKEPDQNSSDEYILNENIDAAGVWDLVYERVQWLLKMKKKSAGSPFITNLANDRTGAWDNHVKHVPDTYCRPLAATCHKKKEHAR